MKINSSLLGYALIQLFSTSSTDVTCSSFRRASSTVPPIYVTHADIIANSSVAALFSSNVVVSESDRVIPN